MFIVLLFAPKFILLNTPPVVFTQLYLECGELGVIGKSRGRVRENSRGVEWVLFACALSFPRVWI